MGWLATLVNSIHTYVTVGRFLKSFGMFTYYYFGKLATQSYKNMSDCVYDSKWQQLTHRLQKYIVIMIMNMQKPLYYHGFEVAILDLNTFLRVSSISKIICHCSNLIITQISYVQPFE